MAKVFSLSFAVTRRGVVTFKMYEGRATVMMVPGRGMQVAKTYQWYNAATK